MINMRLKLGTTRNNEWRCCFCLHVRTATILLGVWHLILHVIALTVLALLMRNHHHIVRKHDEFPQNDFLPTPLSKKDDDNPYFLPTTQDGRYIYPSDVDMGALMTVCTLSITLLMVYGVIKGKATHLLPYFCLQLFDFAITTLTATGYFCYLRSVHRLVAEHWHNLPFRNDLLQLSPQCLSLIVLAAFLISMLWKAYWIGIVWRCYRYLTLRQHTMRNTIHYILPGDGSDLQNQPDYFRNPEMDFNSVAFKQTLPPSYQDVMEDQPPPYITNPALEEPSVRFGVYAFPTVVTENENNAVEACNPTIVVQSNEEERENGASNAETEVKIETDREKKEEKAEGSESVTIESK